jgi:hypothetical protein
MYRYSGAGITFHIERQTRPMIGQNRYLQNVAVPVNYLIIRAYLRSRSEGAPACWCRGTELAEGLQQVKGLTCPLEDGIGELGVGDSDLAEQVQVGGHHDPGTKVHGRRETGFIRKVVG